MYCHSAAGRKPSQTSNILLSFKLSARLMLSCHCCGVSASHTHHDSNNVEWRDVIFTVQVFSVCDTLVFSLFMVVAIPTTHFCSNTAGTSRHLPLFPPSTNLTYIKASFFVHIVTVMCGCEQTRLLRGGRSGTAEVLFMQIRWRRAMLVFSLAWNCAVFHPLWPTYCTHTASCALVGEGAQNNTYCILSLW